MNKITPLMLCALLAGCAMDTNPPKTAAADPDLILYRCENDVAFTVKFANDSATVNSNRGYEVLYRTKSVNDGGPIPTQTVYSNPRMRAEFGLGSTGKEAVLRYLLQPVVVRCARE